MLLCKIFIQNSSLLSRCFEYFTFLFSCILLNICVHFISLNNMNLTSSQDMEGAEKILINFLLESKTTCCEESTGVLA